MFCSQFLCLILFAATVLTPPSQLKDMHRPPRHMGNKAMEPMDSLLMSAIPRLRALPPTGRLHMQLLMDSLPLVIPLQLPPRRTASLSKDMALGLMTPPLLPSPQRRPLMQLSLHTAPSLPTQPMASSQQPLHPQDHRMVTSLLRLVNLNLAQGVITNPA